MSINTSKSWNFINTKENTDFIIIPEYRLENSQQYTVHTITNYKTNFDSGTYGYIATIKKKTNLILDNTMRKTFYQFKIEKPLQNSKNHSQSTKFSGKILVKRKTKQ